MNLPPGIANAPRLRKVIRSTLYAPCADGRLPDWMVGSCDELKHVIREEGKTTVLVYNGGTEQRGPQAVAGHTLMGRVTAKAIAAAVMPFSVNDAKFAGRHRSSARAVRRSE
jgi:hypothetical protein